MTPPERKIPTSVPGAVKRRDKLTPSQRTIIAEIASKYKIPPMHAYQIWESQFIACTHVLCPDPYTSRYSDYPNIKFTNLFNFLPSPRSLKGLLKAYAEKALKSMKYREANNIPLDHTSSPIMENLNPQYPFMPTPEEVKKYKAENGGDNYKRKGYLTSKTEEGNEFIIKRSFPKKNLKKKPAPTEKNFRDNPDVEDPDDIRNEFKPRII